MGKENNRTLEQWNSCVADRMAPDELTEELARSRASATRGTETEETVLTVVIGEVTKLSIEGVASILSKYPEIGVVGSGRTYAEIVEICRRVRPNAVLLSANIDKSACAQTVKLIRKASPRSQVIVLASQADIDVVLDSVAVGALGFCDCNDVSGLRLRGAIWGVSCGCYTLDSSLGLALEHILGKAPAVTRGVLASLTDRERSVLDLVTQGLSNKAIAQKLFLSEATVKKSVSSVSRKFHVNNRVQLATVASSLRDEWSADVR